MKLQVSQLLLRHRTRFINLVTKHQNRHQLLSTDSPFYLTKYLKKLPELPFRLFQPIFIIRSVHDKNYSINVASGKTVAPQLADATGVVAVAEAAEVDRVYHETAAVAGVEVYVDRIAGVLIGSALGDAIGLYTEFLSAATAAAAYPTAKFTLGGGPGHSPATPTPFKLDLHRAPKHPGDWTDDTDHALLVLLAFLHTARSPGGAVSGFEFGLGSGSGSDGDGGGKGGTSKGGEGTLPLPLPLPTQQALAARLRVWVSQGFRPLETMPLGLGRLVSSVVASAGFDAEPERVAREYWERTGRRVAPNGSLMRTHPLGVICLFRAEEEAFEIAATLSRVTHFDPRCVLACVLGTGLVRALARGEVVVEEDVDAVMGRALKWFQATQQEADKVDSEELWRHIGAGGGLDDLKLDEQAAIGYVYKTLGSGVVLLRMAIRRLVASKNGLLGRTLLFEQLITDLIMRGGDADTNACFAGALLGAYLSYSALPDHWKHGLKHGEWLLSKSAALCQVLGVKDGFYAGAEDKDTDPLGGKPAISQEEMEGRWMVLQQATFRKMEDAAKASSKASGSTWSSFLWKRGSEGNPR
ncbi:ADP-ribosylglycohydrolase-domain-containing protein [Chaetomium sp. MPI-CAGE-AT-0009]|nr:ADP-ribosylglycohydrolase-domain-containing protein [Chaetomium sp. MPI-CAGE-AT-0009]